MTSENALCGLPIAAISKTLWELRGACVLNLGHHHFVEEALSGLRKDWHLPATQSGDEEGRKNNLGDLKEVARTSFSGDHGP